MSDRMQADVIIAVLKRWIEVLARLVLAWREHRRSQRTLMISEENGALLVRQSGADAAGRNAERKPKVLSAATARLSLNPAARMACAVRACCSCARRNNLA